MCNVTKAVDQRESDLARTCSPPGGPIQHLRPILSTDSTILKYHRLAAVMVKLLFGVFAAVFLVLGLMALGLSTA